MIISNYFKWTVLLFVLFSTGEAGYSIKFIKKNNVGFPIPISYIVKVNAENADSGTINVPFGGTDWIDFNAAKGDIVNVLAQVDDGVNLFGFYYIINNAENGGGEQIYDSTTSTFTPLNTCTPQESPCPFYIGRATSTAWGDTRATVYFNGIPVISDYDGIGSVNVMVKSTDVIVVKFDWVQGTADSILVGYYLAPAVWDGVGPAILWYYNSYGTDTLISNPFPISSPFGGSLYPISSEQESTFAQQISSGGNIRWI
jgi:hypothetical protein